MTEILVQCSKDDLEYFRKLSLDLLADLISKKCELDDIILGILINKLGDLSKKVQQHAIKCLTRLLYNHAELAPITIHETNLLLQRPAITPV